MQSDVDYDKVDCFLKHPGLVFPDDASSGPIIQVQLKATASPSFIENGNKLSFPIEKKFCKLVNTEKTNLRFLFVLHCPEDENTWVTIDTPNNCVKAQHIMYWAGLPDIPCPGDDEDLDGTKSIHIPVTQVVTCELLKKMMSAQANKDLSELYGREVTI